MDTRRWLDPLELRSEALPERRPVGLLTCQGLRACGRWAASLVALMSTESIVSAFATPLQYQAESTAPRLSVFYGVSWSGG